MATTTDAGPEAPAKIHAKKRPGDLVFSGTALGAGIIILAVLAAVTIFLVIESIPAFTTPSDENPLLKGQTFLEYTWPLVFGTIWSSILALVMAAPLAIGIALFISHYAPRRAAAGAPRRSRAPTRRCCRSSPAPAKAAPSSSTVVRSVRLNTAG